MFVTYPNDTDGYIFALAMGMGPWQLLSAIGWAIFEPRLRTLRQIYLAISFLYLVVIIPLMTGHGGFIEAIDQPSMFIFPAVMAFLYYLLTIEGLYSKKQ